MMNELLIKIMPNVVEYAPDLFKALAESFQMISISTVISALLGIPLGVLLLVTAPGHILENKWVYSLFGKITNTVRSIPFVILIAALVPLTRLIVGTTIGTKGAIVPLIIGVTPFIARQIEAALRQVDSGVIEAAKAMGSSPWEIITRVILREGLPGIIQAITISIVSLIGYSAMAGTVGGGGIGSFAIQYGYQYFKTDIMIVTILIMIVMVSGVQKIGECIAKRFTH
ncbi:MAG: methionine ABC transporter permease [Cellulosilyticaceae bacterium]